MAVSAVNAADNVTNNIVSIEITDDVGDVENNEEILEASNIHYSAFFTTLADEISNADGELNLTRNYIYGGEYSIDGSKYEEGITIKKTIVINGNGHTISGNNQVRVFDIKSNNVVLKNICFVDCSSKNDGGAIRWSGYFGTMDNCAFVNCSASERGGSVYYISSRYVLSNCTFVNSNAKIGGAVDWFGSYGSLSNCDFEDCSATEKGGAIYWFGDKGRVSDCSFTDCSSKNYGGAVYWAGTNGTLSNSSFLDCSAKNGGAIYWDGDCNYDGIYGVFANEFISCSASENGGAVYWNGYYAVLKNSKFVDCSAENDGGAVYCYSYWGISDNSSFKNCHAKDYGGGIYFKSSNCRLIYPTFKGNTALEGPDWYSVEPLIIINDTQLPTVISAPDINTPYGVSATLTATLKNIDNHALAGEQISIIFNKKTYTEITDSMGKVSIYIPKNLKPNVYMATISYAGNDKYKSSNITSKVTVNRIGTVLYAKDVTADYNEDTNLVATLKDSNDNAIKGAKVTIGIGFDSETLTTDTKGQVSLTTKGLEPHTYTARIAFDGDEMHIKSSTTAKITIKKLETKLTAKYDADSKNIIVDVKDVDGNPISNLEVYFENNYDIHGMTYTDAKGHAKYYISRITDKTNNVDVQAHGNKIYEDSNIATVSFSPTQISTILTSNDVVTTYNGGAKLVATLKDSNGKSIKDALVKIVLGNIIKTLTTDTNGQVSMTTDGLVPNTYTATITFDGDTTYKNSGTTAKVTINKLKTKLTAKYNVESKNIVATINDVNGNPVSGLKVGFEIDGVKYITTDPNGQAKYSTAGLADGTYKVTVQAYGNEIYKDSNKETVTFTIGSKEMSKIFLRNALYFVTQTKMVQVTLWDGNNHPLANKTVYIRAYDSIWHGVTDENGDAFIRVGIGFGVHDATVSFDGDDRYSGSERSGYIRVIKETPSVMVRGADSQFKAKDLIKIVKVHLRDRYNKPLPAGSKIALKLNGQTYIGFTNSEGVAHIGINIKSIGTFDAKAIYGGNSAYNAVTRDIKISIKWR